MGIDKYRKIINIINESIYLFVVFSIPLVFSPEEFLGFYQLPKEFILHFGSNLLLILLPIIFILNPQKLISNIINNRLIILSILFILFSYAISTLFSISILGSLWAREYGMSSNSLQTFFSLSVISINIIITNFDKSQIKRLFLAIFASSTIVGSIALMQNFAPNIFKTFTFYHQDRVVSTLGNPIYLGSFLLMGNLLSIIYLFGFSELKINNKSRITLIIISLSIQITAILLSLSRGPSISFFIGYISIAIAYFYLKEKSIKNLVILFVIPVLLSTAIVNIPTFNDQDEYFDELVERSGSISKELELSIDVESGVNILSPNSLNYRGENWIGAFKLLRSWPTVLDNSNSNYWRLFVGYGPDTYIYVYPITVPIQDRIVISANAHNLFLNILIENGAIGFISIIFLIWVIFKKLRYKFINSNNSSKFIALSFGIIIISRLLEQTLGIAVINDLLYFYLMVSLISLFTRQKQEVDRKFNLNLESGLVRNGFGLTISICVILSTIFTIKDYNSTLSGFYFGKAIGQLNSSDIDNAIINLEKARNLNKRSEYIQTELFKISFKIYK
ncbi:MAG: O-antigen ligase family protein [Chloroflexota bacterium]|nr:O-antigen ligase family protein [Chloroflexota bacterium]